MAVVESCLTPTELEQFLLGHADDSHAALIEAHLEHCPKCQEVLRQAGAVDDLVRALRHVNTPTDSPSDLPLKNEASELVDLLVPHFQNISTDEDTAEMADGKTDATATFRTQTLTPEKVSEPDQGPASSLGRYEIRSVLGRGGMGEVLHAYDSLLQRSVAIKVLQTDVVAESEVAERLIREAQAAAAVEHDHIVPIFSVEIHGSHPCIVMPLLKGQSLHQRLEKSAGPLPLEDILRIGREAAEGLGAAHERGLIHCDIKPANLWLEAPRDRVKILDFGLAIPNQDASRERGSISGTPGYIAPEQAKGLPLDARTDLFSLGCVLYRMATGRAPFTGDPRFKALWTVITEPPIAASELNDEIPFEISDLISRMMARNPDGRPASAQEIVAAFDEFQQRRVRERALKIRRRWLTALLGVALLSGGSVGAWALFTVPQATKPMPVTLLGSAEALAIKLRRDGQEVPVLLTAESIVSLPPGEYSTHLVQEQPGRELLPRTFVVDENEPRTVSMVLVGERAHHTTHTRAVTGLAVATVTGRDNENIPVGIWSVGLDRSLVFWDGASATAQRFTNLPHEARCVAVSPNGTHLATGGGNKQIPHELAIRVWQSRSLVEHATMLEGHHRMILAMAYSPDQQHLASAGADGVLIWDLSANSYEVLPESDANIVHALAFSVDGKRLLTAGENGTVAVWDMATRTLHRSHVIGEATVRAVAFLLDGYIAAGDEGTLWQWTGTEEKPQALLKRHQAIVTLAVSPVGDQLLFGDTAGAIGVWSLKSQQLSYEFTQHRGPVNAVAYVGDGRRAVSGGTDRTVRLWQLPLP